MVPDGLGASAISSLIVTVFVAIRLLVPGVTGGAAHVAPVIIGCRALVTLDAGQVWR
jgi:hypothetical protein